MAKKEGTVVDYSKSIEDKEYPSSTTLIVESPLDKKTSITVEVPKSNSGGR